MTQSFAPALKPATPAPAPRAATKTAAPSDTMTEDERWTELANLLLDMLEASDVATPAKSQKRPTTTPDPPKTETTTNLAPQPDPAGTAQPNAPLPGGSETRLLMGEVKPPVAGPVAMPAFPKGDTPLPPAQPVSSPAAAAPPPAATKPATPGPGDGHSPAGIVRRWQGQVRNTGTAIPAPDLPLPAGGAGGLRKVAKGAQTRNAAAREGLTEDALATVPKAPELDTTPPAPPPPNPVPTHTKAVLDASGQKLPAQASLPLEPSPKHTVEGQKIGGTLPPLGVRPVDPALFQILITPKAKSLAELPASATPQQIEDRTETPEQRRISNALKTLTETGDAPEREGRGPQVITPDLGPYKAEAVSPGGRAQIGELVTRLMSDTNKTAGDILTRLRKNAFAQEALHKNFPDICADLQPGLETALIGDLRGIAEAAGITGSELDTMVATRQQELDAAKLRIADDVIRTGDETRTTIESEGQKTADQIAGAAEAAQAETLRRQTAIAGENDPSVVNARRDNIVAWFREHVTTQITTYQRAGDKRRNDLTTAQTEQEDAYRVLAQREIYQLMTPSPPRPDRNQQDKARETALADTSVKIRSWTDEKLKAVAEFFRKALGLAARTTTDNRNRIETAGSTGIEAARQWAEDKILSNKSWWERFVTRIRRWLSEAKDVNEQWRVRRGQENAKAITDDILAAELAAKYLAKEVDENVKQQILQMTAAQRAAFETFVGGGKNMHPLDFAARRLGDNLARDQQSNANQTFEAALIAMPVAGGDEATANRLNDVARTQGSGFDAARIAENVHAAMDQWGTDEQRIFDALRSMTALQGAVVRKMYRARYKRDLDEDLRWEMGGEELDQAMAELEGKQAKADAIALHDAMSGLGTDEATIMRTLRNKSEAEREAIRAEYQRIYGVTLDADLKSDLGKGNEIDQANALLAGDNELADAIELDEAMRGGLITSLGTDEGRITEVQDRVRSEVLAMARTQHMTSAEMEAEVRRRMGLIDAKFSAKYVNVEQYNAPGIPGKTILRKAFASELSGGERDLANALQDNNMIAADGARIEIERTSFYASDDKINDVLRGQYERALAARRLDEGPARDMRVRRLVEDLLNKPGIDDNEISRQRMALERQMEKELETGAQTDSKMSMQSLKDVYQDKYFWPLDFVVETSMSGEERNKARDMLAQGGKLTPLQEITYATRSLGTDEATVRKVVGSMTKAELDILADQWEKQPENKNKKFRDMLISELDGRDLFDVIDMYDHGKPTSALEQIAQEERRVKRETEDLTGVFGGAAAGNEAEWMKSELSRLQDLKDGLTKKWDNTPEAREERARLSEELDFRVGRVQSAVEDHRRKIDNFTDMATQAVGIVVGLVVAAVVNFATAGTAAPIMIAIIASLYATAATMATKILIKGGAYGVEDAGIDAAVGVIDAAMSAATGGLGTKILGPIKALVTKTRLPALAGALGKTGAAQRLARMEGTSMLSRAGRAVAPTREGVERALATFVAEGVSDSISSVPSSVIQTLADDSVWKGDPLANFLSGGGMAILQSAAMSRALHIGTSLGGSALGHAKRAIFEPGNIGRVRELNAMISEHYGSYRTDNPGASLGDFLASPKGRRLQTDIDRSGLMKEIEASVAAAQEATVPQKARAEAEAQTQKPRSDGAPENAPQLDAPDQRLAAMQQVLPKSIRQGTFVTPDATLTGRTVKVEPLRIGNRIVGVDIRVGPGATALDVALHAGTVHAMQKYTGTLGNIRRALHDFNQHNFGPDMPTGSRGWEARGEVEKLGALIHDRLESFAGGKLDPAAQARALSDFQAFEQQFHQNEAILNDPVARREPGRGFIAAESDTKLRGPDLPEGTTLRSAKQMRAMRSEEDAGTPGRSLRSKSAPRPPLLAELDKMKIGDRVTADGTLTPNGRLDLVLRLDAARNHIDSIAHGVDVDTATKRAKQILDDTARRFGIDIKSLERQVTTPEGDPDLRAILRQPLPDAPEPGPIPEVTDLTDKEFLQAAFDAMPRDEGAAAGIGVDDILAGIARGDPEAQEMLNSISGAPAGYSLKDVSWADMEKLLRGNRKGINRKLNPDTGSLAIGDGVVIIDGRRLKGGKRALDKDGNRIFTFRQDFPSFAKAGKTVLQLAGGRMRVWRAPDNTLMLETFAAPSSKRQHHERAQDTHTEAGLEGPFTELAHGLGAGLGSESPFGIRRALVHVNQELQARGIEKYIGDLRDHAPPGVTFAYRLEIGDQLTDNRLASATYGIDMIINGKRVPMLEFRIDTRPLPDGVDPATVSARELISIDPIEPRGFADLDHATQVYVSAFLDTVRPPENITRMDVADSVSAKARADLFRQATPAQVANLVDTNPDLRQVAVPPGHAFDMATLLAEVAKEKYRPDNGKLIIIDLRGAGLSDAQIIALRKAISPFLYGRSGADVVLIEPVAAP